MLGFFSNLTIDGHRLIVLGQRNPFEDHEEKCFLKIDLFFLLFLVFLNCSIHLSWRSVVNFSTFHLNVMMTHLLLLPVRFESVLSTLEDAVNDAPKAPEFLGRIFGKIIVENVIPLSEIGRILHEGGEKRGQLLEAGLAADVLGCTLEVIQSDKGDAALHEIRGSSKLRLEDFRPPGPMTSRMLEKFI